MECAQMPLQNFDLPTCNRPARRRVYSREVVSMPSPFPKAYAMSSPSPFRTKLSSLLLSADDPLFAEVGG